MDLRLYQKNAVNAAVRWVNHHEGRGGMIVAPTGSGKSHILAAICQQIPPNTITLIITPSREIVDQDARVMEAYGIQTGICCAGLGRHDLPDAAKYHVIIATPATLRPEQITEAGYQKALVIIDEAHRLNVVDQDTMFRAHITRVREVWPDANLIGLTATPWRLQQGDIIGNDIWQDTIYHITMEELIGGGYLVPAVAYAREVFTDDDLKNAKYAGEYQFGKLGQIIAGKNEANELGGVMDEICDVMRAHHRKHMLIYLPTVDTAWMVRNALRDRDVNCAVVSGETPAVERKRLLDAFKAGNLEALCNCAILTTGFDAPATDMIVLLIATASRTKYYQILGRGMRPHPDKKDCLIFDGGGNVQRHGLNPDITEARRLVPCEACHRMVSLPSDPDAIYRSTVAGNFLACPDCGAHFFACPFCDHEWWLPKDQAPPEIICPKCDRQIYPPPEGKGGGGGAKLKIHAEIPYKFGEPIRTESGKTFMVYAPIGLHEYLSVRQNPCILVKNAFPGKNAYIVLISTATRAAMWYICSGNRIINHRREPVPDHATIWAHCHSPALKIIGTAGRLDGNYLKITHFLVFSRTTGYESIEIDKNYIQSEVIITSQNKI